MFIYLGHEKQAAKRRNEAAAAFVKRNQKASSPDTASEATVVAPSPSMEETAAPSG